MLVRYLIMNKRKDKKILSKKFFNNYLKIGAKIFLKLLSLPFINIENI